MRVVTGRTIVSVTCRTTEQDGGVVEQIGCVSYLHGGDGGLCGAVESAREGPAVGGRVPVMPPSGEGYGPYLAEWISTDDLEHVPEPFREIGAEVGMSSDRGDKRPFVATRIEHGRLSSTATTRSPERR